MNAIVMIHELTKVLQVLIPIGVGSRIAYCLCQIPLDEENAGVMKRRIRNALIFLVLSEVITQLLRIVKQYY